jgi:hypothetical protein
MNQSLAIISIVFLVVCNSSCRQAGIRETNAPAPGTGNELSDFIFRIKAVDNHAHPNSIDPDDKGSDALPLDGLGNIQLPVRVRPESPVWLNAARQLYQFEGKELNE